MNNIKINEKFIIALLMFSLISVYLLFTKPSTDETEKTQSVAGHAENIGTPMLLGKAIPLTSAYVNVALTGEIHPIGGTADPFEFMDGDINSNFTNWIPVSFMHTDFDINIELLHYEATTTPSGKNCEGYIVVKEINPGVNNMLDMSIHYYTNYILVEGIVQNCIIIAVSPETNITQLKAYFKSL